MKIHYTKNYIKATVKDDKLSRHKIRTQQDFFALLLHEEQRSVLNKQKKKKHKHPVSIIYTQETHKKDGYDRIK